MLIYLNFLKWFFTHFYKINQWPISLFTNILTPNIFNLHSTSCRTNWPENWQIMATMWKVFCSVDRPLPPPASYKYMYSIGPPLFLFLLQFGDYLVKFAFASHVSRIVCPPTPDSRCTTDKANHLTTLCTFSGCHYLSSHYTTDSAKATAQRYLGPRVTTTLRMDKKCSGWCPTRVIHLFRSWGRYKLNFFCSSVGTGWVL